MDSTLYMDDFTGSIGTRHYWWYENKNGENVNAVDLGEVLKVQPDLWYDRALKLWTLLWKDEENNQIGHAAYFLSKKSAADWISKVGEV